MRGKQKTKMSIFGKCTEEIKTRLPFEVKNEVERLAHDAMMSESEYLRMVICHHIYGKDEILRLQKEQLEKLTAKVQPKELI